jgi:hypothetical protein
METILEEIFFSLKNRCLINMSISFQSNASKKINLSYHIISYFQLINNEVRFDFKEALMRLRSGKIINLPE